MTCKEGFFRCRSGQCIPNSLHCDKKTDCTDESDEHDCGMFTKELLELR